jgi:hypothetical protein
MPSGTPQSLFLSQPGPRARNGLSLTRNGFRCRGLHPGVDVPGLLLHSLRRSSQARSAVSSTTGTGLLRSGSFSVTARCPFPTAHDSPAPDLRSPSGFLRPSGSKRLPGLCKSARLPNPPDFLSLPASVSISSFDSGSPFLVRYASKTCFTLCGPAFQRGSPSRRIDNSTHAVLQPPDASTGAFGPLSRIRGLNCTLRPLQASTRLSPGFTLFWTRSFGF